MNQTEAKALFDREVSRLLPKYPFLSSWTYGLIRRGSYSRLGLCNYTHRTITINPEYIEKGRDEDVLDTILHELAHAIAVHKFGKKARGHGYLWKSVCREVGADPTRTKDDVGFEFEARVQAKWVLRHKFTGEVFQRYPKKPRVKNWSQRYICGRKHETLGRLEVAINGSPLTAKNELPKEVIAFEKMTRRAKELPPKRENRSDAAPSQMLLFG
jgi:predicted SprT family Zn-dependent metalloprotease